MTDSCFVGAWIPDITGMLDLKSWPTGMRVIIRKEVPHVGAQLRITDIDVNRYTAIATTQEKGQLATLIVRHRLRARCDNRIRVRLGHQFVHSDLPRLRRQ